MTPSEYDAQAWLETDKLRRASDIVLAFLLLPAGLFFLCGGGGDAVPEADAYISPWLFPSLAAGLLCLIALGLLLRAARRRSPPVKGSAPLHIAIVVAVLVALSFAAGTWLLLDADIFLSFGPAEFMALTLLELAVAVALAHSSRARAAGMLLLGLLLSTIGVDAASGILRFTLGTEGLLKGIDGFVLLAGLFIVGDALVCLISVPLFLRTYTRLIAGLRIVHIPIPASFVLRLAAIVALVTASFFAYALSHMSIDIIWIFIFGLLGAAAKILGWNRLLLHLGFAFGVGLEENFRRVMLLGKNNPLAGLEPVGGALLLGAIIILAGAAALSLRRRAA